MTSKKPKAELNPLTKEVEVRTAETRILVDGQVLNEAPPVTAPVVPSKEGQLTFEMYCSARKVPVMNKAGMRAFTKLNAATLREWDRTFLAY